MLFSVILVIKVLRYELFTHFVTDVTDVFATFPYRNLFSLRLNVFPLYKSCDFICHICHTPLMTQSVDDPQEAGRPSSRSGQAIVKKRVADPQEEADFTSVGIVICEGFLWLGEGSEGRKHNFPYRK